MTEPMRPVWDEINAAAYGIPAESPRPAERTRSVARFESDICVIGGGISAAFLAQRLTELHPNLQITVVEAGRRLFDAENRMKNRQRTLLYGENPWPGDFIEDQGGAGVITRTMAVGGSAMHWQGHANRFPAEDLRLHSLYGLAVDWPLSWE